MGVGPFFLFGEFYVFYWRGAERTPFGGIFFVLAFLLAAVLDRRPPVAVSCFLRFYRHSLFGRPSGGSIFLLVKKDRGERHAKGLQSRPLESGFLYGGSEGRRASVLRVRPGAINAI